MGITYQVGSILVCEDACHDETGIEHVVAEHSFEPRIEGVPGIIVQQARKCYGTHKFEHQQGHVSPGYEDVHDVLVSLREERADGYRKNQF